MASILFLVLGDMTAAIIGVSFGGDALGKLRLGREGKKSLEGCAHRPRARCTQSSLHAHAQRRAPARALSRATRHAHTAAPSIGCGGAQLARDVRDLLPCRREHLRERALA